MAEGLSRRLCVDVVIVRLIFAVACLASGAGAIAYVVGWLLIPAEPAPPGQGGGGGSAGMLGRTDQGVSIARTALGDRRGIALCISYVPVLVIVLVVASAVGASWAWSVAWPAFICIAGLTLVWRNGAESDREVLVRAVRPVLSIGDSDRRSYAQIVLWAVVGLGLLFGGLGLLLHDRAPRALWPIIGVVLVLGGVVVVFGPWWLRVARDLVVERQARARAEERADMAAHVHDSVLQTLALIQRRADRPADVTRLARAQERQLRSWLFEGDQSGPDAEAATLQAGIKRIQDEVEADHGIKVEVVTVGDCQLDDDLRALLQAGKEATVNAAKWSKAPSVSLFAELRTGTVMLFVRDRGVGFDPGAVPADRRGLSESIRERLSRHGGTATIRSAPGEGTEVILEMPLRDAGRRRTDAAAS